MPAEQILIIFIAFLTDDESPEKFTEKPWFMPSNLLPIQIKDNTLSHKQIPEIRKKS